MDVQSKSGKISLPNDEEQRVDLGLCVHTFETPKETEVEIALAKNMSFEY
jgi:hypothetical protein